MATSEIGVGQATSRRTTSPVLLVLLGIASVQLGAAVAKTLFDEVAPTTIVWLRLLTSAVVLLVAVRPTWRRRSGRDWALVIAFGVSLAAMNWAIYQSFSRIPLGLAVTVEFAGPLTLSLVGTLRVTRRLRDLVWVGLAGLGVVLLGFDTSGLGVAGVLFALLAAAMWAAYILLSAQTGRRWAGLDGLAAASTVAALIMTPVMLLDRPGDLVSGGGPDWRIVGLGAAVGVLSSVVPYSCELIALRALPPHTFGVLMSLEPAAAALAGVLVVHELLPAVQWLAVACVVVASIGATRRAPAPAVPTEVV